MDQETIRRIKENQKRLFERSWDSKEAAQDLVTYYSSKEWQDYVKWCRDQSIDLSAMSASYGF